MRRLIFAGLTAAVLAAGPPAAPAQQKMENRLEYGPKEPKPEDEDRPPPAMQYAIGCVASLGVLLLLCVPTRKVRK